MVASWGRALNASPNATFRPRMVTAQLTSVNRSSSQMRNRWTGTSTIATIQICLPPRNPNPLLVLQSLETFCSPQHDPITTHSDHVTHQQIKLITVLSKEEQRRQLPNPSPFLTPILKLHSVLLAALRFQKDMAQGKLKGMKTSKQKATRPASSSSMTKKGKRYAAPKKADAIKIASLKRVRMRISPLPSLSTSPASFVVEGSVLCSVLNLVCAGPQRKDQSFDRATYRQRCFIWEAYDYEKRWFSR